MPGQGQRWGGGEGEVRGGGTAGSLQCGIGMCNSCGMTGECGRWGEREVCTKERARRNADVGNNRSAAMD